MYRPISIEIKNILSYEKTFFDFKLGKAILIVGENRDDPGQKGNGSGKSGLNEATVIAITGAPIRNVKNKEVIRQGCDSGEVELMLHNVVSDTTIKIWRRLYSGGSSAEYKMWMNGKEMKDHYSDANSFNSFVFATIGISKEDFYDFYVITKEHYTPFLAVGDTEKKKIINRFSGANKVDGVFEHLDADLVEFDRRVAAADKLIANIKGKQEVLVDQIEKEKQKYSNEYIQQQKDSVHKDIAELNNQINEAKESNTKTDQLIELALSKHLSLDEVDFNKRREEFKEDVIQVTKKRSDLGNNSITPLQNDLRDLISERADLEKKLAGTIECPKCTHHFTLADKTFNVEEGEIVLKEYNEAVVETESLIAKRRVEYDELTSTLSELSSVLKEIDEEERRHKRLSQIYVDEIKGYEKEIETRNKRIAFNLKSIEDLKHDLLKLEKSKSDELDQMDEQLLGYLDEEVALNEQLQQLIIEKGELQQWQVHFKSFKSFLANKSIGNIQDYTNLYLQKMGTNLLIAVDGYKMLSNKKMKEEITTSVLRNGFDIGSYGKFSAGERGRIDVAVILAIQTLINVNSCKNGLDLLILDEIMDSVDSLGLENILKGLEGVDRTVMIISQQEIASLSSQTIIITKKNGISTINSSMRNLQNDEPIESKDLCRPIVEKSKELSRIGDSVKRSNKKVRT